MNTVLFACFFGALAVAAIKPIPPPELFCGPNEFSTPCYNECQRTCKNRIVGSGIVCDAACTRDGCFCKSGYLRHDNGTCVPENQCSPPDCPKGEVFTDCGSSCPASCDNQGDTCTVCTQQCVPGCFCAPGTIKAPDGSCVEPKNCPPRTCSGQNEELDECPPTCPVTQNCSNIWSKIACTPVDCCKPQCRCKSGFFRNDQNVCISGQECMGQTSGSKSSAQADAQTAEASS